MPRLARNHASGWAVAPSRDELTTALRAVVREAEALATEAGRFPPKPVTDAKALLAREERAHAQREAA